VPCFVNYKKGALDSQPQVIVYQLVAHGRWFSLCTLASSTTKTDRHDIAEILLKVALKKNPPKVKIVKYDLILFLVGFFLMPLSTIFQLYHGDQF
jgi:hypothetical protein